MQAEASIGAKGEPAEIAVVPTGSNPSPPGGIERRRTFDFRWSALPFSLPAFLPVSRLFAVTNCLVKGEKRKPPENAAGRPRGDAPRIHPMLDVLTSSAPAFSSCPDIRKFRTWPVLR